MVHAAHPGKQTKPDSWTPRSHHASSPSCLSDQRRALTLDVDHLSKPPAHQAVSWSVCFTSLAPPENDCMAWDVPGADDAQVSQAAHKVRHTLCWCNRRTGFLPRAPPSTQTWENASTRPQRHDLTAFSRAFSWSMSSSCAWSSAACCATFACCRTPSAKGGRGGVSEFGVCRTCCTWA